MPCYVFQKILNLFRICTINFALGLFLKHRLRNGIHPKLTPLKFFYVIYLAAERLQWDWALRTEQLEFRLVGHWKEVHCKDWLGWCPLFLLSLEFLCLRDLLFLNLKKTYMYTVFNLEICQSGSYVPHDILNRVISKMVLVKQWHWNLKNWHNSN